MAIARQPILDAKKTVFGYELFDRSISGEGFSAASDAALLFNLLSSAEREMQDARKPLFINCTHQTLAGGHLELIESDRIVLEVPPMPPDQANAEDVDAFFETLSEVHRRGFHLAFDDSVLQPLYAKWLPLASYVKLDLMVLDMPKVRAVLQQLRNHPKIRCIAEKVETQEQFEQVSQAGATLFQGYWFAKPVLIKGHTLRPSQANIIQLINLVRKQASTDEIEEVFKRDPTLSFNLLRFINSAGFGLRSEVTSFRHAVMLLGLKKLFRWAALLMTTSAGSGGNPAVGLAAVVRGRLMELLATEALSGDDADNAFVTGVFSLLDTMLGLPLQNALESIILPEAVTDALLHNRGPLSPLLQLTLACENADDAQFAKLALQLGLSGDQINWAHLQALAWAENIAM
ncbi:MAG: EAL domain-containing protein [Rhodoferax sp.]